MSVFVNIWFFIVTEVVLGLFVTELLSSVMHKQHRSMDVWNIFSMQCFHVFKEIMEYVMRCVGTTRKIYEMCEKGKWPYGYQVNRNRIVVKVVLLLGLPVLLYNNC